MEAAYPVITQHIDGRDVQRARQRHVGMHRTIIGIVVVLGRETGHARWDVGDKGPGKYSPVFKHGGIEQRFQHTAAAAVSHDHINHFAMLPLSHCRVACISQHIPALNFKYQCRCIMYLVIFQIFNMTIQY